MSSNCKGGADQAFYWMRAAQASAKKTQEYSAPSYRHPHGDASSWDYVFFSCRQMPRGSPGLTVMKHSRMTIDKCSSFCKDKKGSRYFGVTAGTTCWCSVLYFGQELPIHRCRRSCAGDGTETCGGGRQASSVYMLTNRNKTKKAAMLTQVPDTITKTFRSRSGEACGEAADETQAVGVLEAMIGSIEECQAACAKAPTTSKCNGFTYEKETSRCTFHAQNTPNSFITNRQASCFWRVSQALSHA